MCPISVKYPCSSKHRLQNSIIHLILHLVLKVLKRNKATQMANAACRHNLDKQEESELKLIMGLSTLEYKLHAYNEDLIKLSQVK